jgi:hypothetical protein
MGTDIHLAVERREPGGWVLHASEDDGWYADRNYNVFAMLAGVRNGRGFAGSDIGDPVVPVAEPRGIPSDASLDVLLWWLTWQEHTPSWLTARELVDVDWHGNKIVHHGYVDPDNFWRFNQWKKPQEWCADVSGFAIQKVSNTEMLRRIEDLEICTSWNRREYAAKHRQAPDIRSFCEGTYTQIEWTTSWAESAGDFLHTVLAMVRVASLHKLTLDDVRAVFFFDS